MKKTKIIHQDIELEISYYHDPAEDPNYIYPGASERYEIVSIKYNGANVKAIYEANDLIDEIEEELAS